MTLTVTGEIYIQILIIPHQCVGPGSPMSEGSIVLVCGVCGVLNPLKRKKNGTLHVMSHPDPIVILHIKTNFDAQKMYPVYALNDAYLNSLHGPDLTYCARVAHNNNNKMCESASCKLSPVCDCKKKCCNFLLKPRMRRAWDTTKHDRDVKNSDEQ